MDDFFGELLDTAKTTGSDLLKQEIAKYGNKLPQNRPDINDVPTFVAVTPGTTDNQSMDKKTMIYIGAGVAAVALVLVLALRK